MRLKKLVILGFKSFADKVTLDFDAEVIGVVGPNGCGKSNIVDAFRWVMGEQSAKSIRGEKMFDLLFAGTDNRKQQNLVEVAVTLTEVDGKLPTPYDEVTITRRLHRSGESQYLINNQPVRLKDIQNMILGSGIGKNAFSVFEQGKLDQIIHLNPIERRSIFDECAGIGRFLQKKKETLRKLKQALENYNRLKDLHRELYAQTKHLKKQSAEAQTFLENKELLEYLEKAILLVRYNASFDENNSCDTILSALQEKLDSVKATIRAEKDAIEALQQRFVDQEKHVKEVQIKVYQTQNLAQVKAVELLSAKKNLTDTESKQKAIQKEIRDLAGRSAEYKKTMHQHVDDLGNINQEKIDREASLNLIQKQYREIEQEVESQRQQLKKDQIQRLEIIQEENLFAHKFQESRIRKESSEEKQKTIALSIEEDQMLLKEFHDVIQTRKSNVDAHSKEIDKSRKEIDRLEKDLKDSRTSHSHSQKELETLVQQLAQLQARIDVLVRLKEDLEGFSNGAKHLLLETKKKTSPIFGKVSGLHEWIVAKKGFEKLIAAALSPYVQTLVVKTQDDFDAVLQYCGAHSLQGYSLLCTTKKTKSRSKNGKALASCTEKSLYSEHLLAQISIETNIQKALGISRVCVTEDGFFIDHNGVVIRPAVAGAENNTFLREQELLTQRLQLKELSETQEKIKKTLKELSLKIDSLDEKRKALGSQMQKKEMALIEDNFALQRAKVDEASTKEKILSLQNESSALLQQQTTYIELLETLSLQHKNACQKSAQFAQLVKTKEQNLEILEKKFFEIKERAQEKERSYQEIFTRWQQYTHDIQLLEAHTSECQTQENKLEVEKKSLEKQQIDHAVSIETLDSEEKTLSADALCFSSELDEKNEQLQLLKQQLGTLDTKLSSLQNEFYEKQQGVHSQEITAAQQASLRQAIEEELYERFSLSIDAASKFELEMSLDEAHTKSYQLRTKIEKKSATVNMSSIEEYATVSSRFQRLDEDLTDLSEAKSDLEKIIIQLDSESRKIFKETFFQIRTNFQKNFRLLFNGGEADLRFTDSPDVLEAGVEIIAKPPGKQMRSISLLSGGEKCMTALALLFSIFEVRPAPFCILDEVDAPLDDSNIERFTNILKQFTPKTQFIIVTHNKKTMAIADRLFGVSMEEKGVSKLISLCFERQQKEVFA